MVQQKRRRSPESYTARTYRQRVDGGGLFSARVRVRDTDLHVLTDRALGDKATNLALEARLQIERYIAQHPEFLPALSPLAKDPMAPPLVRQMLSAARKAGVGPMAAVAGTIAEAVGRGLIASGCREVIVENGGDNYIHRTGDCTVGIFAGESPLSMKVGIRLAATRMPLGVCTSSGTIGHSLSLGRGDSITVLSASTALADAAATRVGNEIGGTDDIEKALECAISIDGVEGAIVICGEKLGAIGNVELIKLEDDGDTG